MRSDMGFKDVKFENLQRVNGLQYQLLYVILYFILFFNNEVFMHCN